MFVLNNTVPTMVQPTVVLFAGRTDKADDVIVRKCESLLSSTNPLPETNKGEKASSNVMVVTADRGLIERCERYCSSKKRLQILSPINLLQDIERLASVSAIQIYGAESDMDEISPTGATGTVDISPYELKVAADLLHTETVLRTRLGMMTKKRKKKLHQKCESLRNKLDSDSILLEYVQKILAQGHPLNGSSLLQTGEPNSGLNHLSPRDQKTLLDKWNAARATSNRKETTKDRVQLAETFRKELEHRYGINRNQYPFNSRSDLDNSIPLEKETVRFVILSDTHGFEESMNSPLPEGDVLLHLGDFAMDGKKQKDGLEEFDRWWTSQPHPIKLIIRGNHDPRTWLPASGMYITRPKNLRIGNISMSLVPYANSGAIARSLPKTCDILATHVPPRNLLDLCTTGKHAGSRTLRKHVEKMKAGPPCLWMFGHIHEARGAVKHSFCLDRSTLVVNAAQANSGMAAYLKHSATVIDVIKKSERKPGIASIAEMSGQFVFMSQNQEAFFERRADPGITQLLLSIDLGLRTGITLYSEDGKLLRYQGFDLSSVEELEFLCEDILKSWENPCPENTQIYKITHIAIEGGDPPLRQAWQTAAGDRSVINIKPSEWRNDLLRPEERLNGEKAKEASCVLANDIILQYGISDVLASPLSVDVAESIMLGLHVSRRLGWINREPPIERNSPGVPTHMKQLVKESPHIPVSLQIDR